MKFSINQKDLYNALNIVRRAVAKNQTLPILTGIFLSLENNTLTLKSTDLELGIKYNLKADGQIDGSIVLPATQFINIIRERPNEEVKIELYDKDTEELIKTTYTCTGEGDGEVGHFKLRGVEVGSYFVKVSVTINNVDYAGQKEVEITEEDVETFKPKNIKKIVLTEITK